MNHFEPLGLGAGSFIAGRYDVVTRLGAGGMSAVFKVVDRKLNNDTIALKLFEPKLLSDASQLERFRQEVLITRKLTHPNIVRTHDFGEAPESHYYFMTMEYVPGVGLDKLIHSHEPPTFVESMRIFCEVLKGVAYAHEMGVIHRDLKPANILVGENNEVKIADFGLAKSLEMNKQFTQAGECVGTPFYMAPEQIQEQELDERTDVYALGIIAYELVMGKVPFDKESWFDLASQIIKEPLQDFATKKNRVPFWFQEFVKRATAKRKEERFRSVQEMLVALERNLESSNQDELNVGHTTRRMQQGLDRFEDPEERNFFLFKVFAGIIAVCCVLLTVLLMLEGNQEVSGHVDRVSDSLERGATMVDSLTDKMERFSNAAIALEQNKDKVDKLLQAFEANGEPQVDPLDPEAAPQKEQPKSFASPEIDLSGYAPQ